MVLDHAAHDALEVCAKSKLRNLLELINDDQHPTPLRTQFLWQFKSFAQLRCAWLRCGKRQRQFRLAVITDAQHGTDSAEKPH